MTKFWGQETKISSKPSIENRDIVNEFPNNMNESSYLYWNRSVLVKALSLLQNRRNVGFVWRQATRFENDDSGWRD